MKATRSAIVGVVGGFLVILVLWALKSIEVVGEDEILILIRRYFGRPLPPHKTVADQGEKGPLRNVLGPGFHFVPAWIYRTEKYPVTKIDEGMIGVLIALSGRDLAPGKIIVKEESFPEGEVPPHLKPYVGKAAVLGKACKGRKGQAYVECLRKKAVELGIAKKK